MTIPTRIIPACLLLATQCSALAPVYYVSSSEGNEQKDPINIDDEDGNSVSTSSPPRSMAVSELHVKKMLGGKQTK